MRSPTTNAIARIVVVIASWTAASASAKTVVCPGPVTLDGIDVSYWQLDIDWAKVKAAGKKYAIMRAAHALKADTKFAFNWKKCHELGLRCGVYQYFEPDIDPIAQADLMLQMMGKLAPGDLPPVIDVESKGGATPTQLAAAVGKWIAHVEKAVGRKPMIYTGAYFWEDYVKSTAFVAYPLWHAQYCTSCCPNIANPWKQWAFWQHSSTGKVSGINGNVDLNRFNGDAKALDDLADIKACTPGCKGSVITQADCSTGDCGAYGAYCSLATSPKPKCVSAFCAASATATPKAGDVCLPDGKRYACSATGDLTAKPCPAGDVCTSEGGGAVCKPTTCQPKCAGSALVAADCKALDCAGLPGAAAGSCVNDALGPRCVSQHCPPQGKSVKCLSDPAGLAMGMCQDGVITVSSCAAGSEVCAAAPAVPGLPALAACADKVCAPGPGKALAAHAACADATTRRLCDDWGKATLDPCPPASLCVQQGDSAACVGDGPGGEDAGSDVGGGDAGNTSDVADSGDAADGGGDGEDADGAGVSDAADADAASDGIPALDGEEIVGDSGAGGGDVPGATDGETAGRGVDGRPGTDAGPGVVAADGGATGVSAGDGDGGATVATNLVAAPASGCGAGSRGSGRWPLAALAGLAVGACLWPRQRGGRWPARERRRA